MLACQPINSPSAPHRVAQYPVLTFRTRAVIFIQAKAWLASAIHALAWMKITDKIGIICKIGILQANNHW